LSKFNPMHRRLPILKRLVPSIKRRWARLTMLGGYCLRRSGDAVFLLNPENFVDRQIAFYDDFEAAQMDYLFAAMRQHGCDLFLDIGANIGLYSIRVALAGLTSRVTAFEPDRRNLQQLGANILLNRLTGKITVVDKAVSAQSGSVGFQPASERSTGQSQVVGEGGVAIDAVALDDFIIASDQRIFAKIDIEGHELSALQGMRRLIAGNRVFLQIESFQQNIEAVEAEVASLGLRRVHRIDDDHYFTNL